MGVKDVEENRSLVDVLDVLNLLSDVLGSGAYAANGEEDVVLEEIPGKHLDVAGESGREHESLAVLDARHILALDNAADLGLKTHVKHTISLVEDQVLDVAQRDATSLYEIDQSSGGGNKQIAATLNLAELGADISATVDDARADPRAVGELAGLVVDLRDKLTRGCENKRGRVRFSLASEAAALAARDGRRAVDEGLRQDGEEETTSLSRASLGTGHEIASTHDDRNRVLLYWGRDTVPSELDVLDKVGLKRGVGEGQDRVRHILTRGFNGNVIVLLEVDTGVLLRRIVGSTKELTLKTRVGRSRNMLSIAPLAVSRAAGVTTTTTTAAAASATTSGGSRVAIRVGVEAALTVAAPVAVVGSLLLLLLLLGSRKVVGTAPVLAGASVVVVVSEVKLGSVSCHHSCQKLKG